MQIIVIPGRLAKARSISLSLPQLVAAAMILFCLLAGLTAALYWFTLRLSAAAKMPFVEQVLLSAQRAETVKSR
ncbi:MAG: hypothetical protein WCA09_17110, partial [Burkholderiales bacterium]